MTPTRIVEATKLVEKLRAFRQDPRPWPEMRDEYLATERRLKKLLPPVTKPLQ